MDRRRRNRRKFNHSPRGRFIQYRYNARKRGIQFRLSFSEFVAYWRRPCFYCGYPIRTIGLDRINNSKGYILGNIRACCLWCNRTKSDLSERQFFDYCLRVVLARMLRMRALRREKLALFSGSAPRTWSGTRKPSQQSKRRPRA